MISCMYVCILRTTIQEVFLFVFVSPLLLSLLIAAAGTVAVISDIFRFTLLQVFLYLNFHVCVHVLYNYAIIYPCCIIKHHNNYAILILTMDITSVYNNYTVYIVDTLGPKYSVDRGVLNSGVVLYRITTIGN